MFHNKWLTLIDRANNDFDIKGYLKCDLFMFYGHKDNLKLLKPLYSVIDDNEINEKYPFTKLLYSG